MKTADALYEYLRTEVVPMIAGDSEFAASLINGVLRSSRKKLAPKLTGGPLLQAIGLADENGEVDADAFREFADGMFDGKDSISVSIGELVKLATGFESESPLLAGRLTLTRADADKILGLLLRE
jgi:hypothetical protein